MIRAILVAACIAIPIAAGAQTPTKKIAIFPAVFNGPYGAASPGQVFNTTLQALGLRLDVQALSYESMFLSGATSHVTAAAHCGSEQACIVRVMEEAGAALGLRTIVNFALDPPLLSLELISTDAEIKGQQAVLDTGGNPWAQSLTVAVRALVDQQGLGPAGRVRVRADPLALVTLPDSPIARREAAGLFRAPPGRHRVLVRAPDGREASVFALISAHQTTEIAVDLPRRTASAPKDGSVFESAWFWGSIGAFALGAATAAVLVSNSNSGSGAPACLCVTTVDHPCGTCP